MPIEFRRSYLEEIRYRYANSTKKQKSLILAEFCQVCGYSRKHAIRILNRDLNPRIKKPGPGSRYQREDVLNALRELHNLMGEMCSKKMVVAFEDWLGFYKCSKEVKDLLRQMSSSTIDRLLRPYRFRFKRGLSATRPSLITNELLSKNRIPLKLLDGEVTIPGFIEADTVAHCGNSLAGDFANSLTLTDLMSGWTENRAVWTKSAERVTDQVKAIESRLPFTMIGFASDNGTEFLNEKLLGYLTDRSAPVKMVRRRPYKKNDNAHIKTGHT